jgi:hypothetical protein
MMIQPSRTILILGSGLMAESLIAYLLSNPKVHFLPSRIVSILPLISLKRPEFSLRREASTVAPIMR